MQDVGDFVVCLIWYLGGSRRLENTPTGCANNLPTLFGDFRILKHALWVLFRVQSTLRCGRPHALWELRVPSRVQWTAGQPQRGTFATKGAGGH